MYLLCFTVSFNMRRRLSFHARGFGCPFVGCRYLCKSPGGLTRHKASCSKNPANIYNPLPSTTHSQSQSLPRTPSPFHQQLHDLVSPPQTPAIGQNSPVHQSPRRIRWTQNGRAQIRIHPYLDGALFIYLFQLFFNAHMGLQGCHVMKKATIYQLVLHLRPLMSARQTTTRHMARWPNLSLLTSCSVRSRCQATRSMS
jgi:hypothetical protein